MQRTEEDVATLVQDVERTIAGMHIHVDQRDLAEFSRQVVRGDAGIVEKAESVGTITHGVVTRRTTQGIGRARTRDDVLGGCDGGLG